MVQELPHLPPEVWLLLFRYLNTAEKHIVRLCCKDLKKLVDHPSLWKDYTVFLGSLVRYTSGFWDMLNQRKITRVAVRHLQPKDWRYLIQFLPSLSSIVCIRGRQRYTIKYLHYLSDFPDLQGFGIRNAAWDEPLLLQLQVELLAERLTHLSICNIELPSTKHFLNCVSQLVNLQYLLLHQLQCEEMDMVKLVPCNLFHSLLLNLKKLKHLSWGMKARPLLGQLPENYFYPLDPEKPGAYGGPALTALELINYPETALSANALMGLTSLKSLFIRYDCVSESIPCRLQSWLSTMPQLESLTIIGGNSLPYYTSTFPPHLKRLTLRVLICLSDLEAIADKLKELEHLDMDQNHYSGSLCELLPTLFPQLRTLRIRFYREAPQRDLLSLNALSRLERLELIVERSYVLRDRNGHLWPTPALQELIGELRQSSGNRSSSSESCLRRFSEVHLYVYDISPYCPVG
ncbi:uncharacterized protein LOC115794900 [Archocentrus centrarchus]|uniref:uncharacterized protein LOC115794900 n=1 Tax=Archocentrus centrarchus TaxID=63155 RepID=UPI0011E9D83F|nr:uncharacterized protein LOC115794900 [Archocentrus centrarchus]